ncbi:hypothetical protein MRB53_040141 [Persea americana]|nr:hypothetical protein MRB53_040141 [Persea americana]
MTTTALQTPSRGTNGVHSFDTICTPVHHYSCSRKQTASKSRASLALLARETVASLSSIGTNRDLKNSSSAKSLRKLAASPTHSQLSLSRNSTSASERSTQAGTPPTSPTASDMSSNERPRCKLHQTSSKAVRTTAEGRPFTKDFEDLFSTLITSLPLRSHRARFQKVEHSFLCEEAIANLSSLTLKQSNRMPDPNQAARWIVTTTTTSFSMTPDMAKRTCQRFVEARFVESAEGKSLKEFPTKGVVYQLTLKGIQVLKRFCDRNGIDEPHLQPLLRRAQMHVVVLERNTNTDKPIQDRSTIEVLFRRMCGVEVSDHKSSSMHFDARSATEDTMGAIGVKMAKDKKIAKILFHLVSQVKPQQIGCSNRCSTTDQCEAYELCELFVRYHMIKQVVVDDDYKDRHNTTTYQSSKNAIYAITSKGQIINGWDNRASGSPSELNIEHSLRQRLDNRMTKMNADEDAMREALQKTAELMEQASESVARLMATVSSLRTAHPTSLY